MTEAHKCDNDKSNGCTYTRPKYSFPPMVRDVAISLMTIGIVGLITVVLKLDKTMSITLETAAARQASMDRAVNEVKAMARDTREGLLRLDTSFARFESSSNARFYTLHQAGQDQKESANELKKVWDAVHRIQLDVVRLQNGCTASYDPPKSKQ